MDANILYQLACSYAVQESSPHHKFINSVHDYMSINMPSQSSFVRSSATRAVPVPIPVPSSNPSSSYFPGYASPMTSNSPGSSISGRSVHDRSPLETPLEYPLESEFVSVNAGAGAQAQMLKDEYADATAAAVAASHAPWQSVERPVPMDIYHNQLDMSSAHVIVTPPAVPEVAMGHQYPGKAEDYRNPEEFTQSMYYGFAQEPSLHQYSHIVSGTPQSLPFNFSHQDYIGKAAAAIPYTPLPELQYPSSPEEHLRFVHPAQVSSPSPGISPSGDYAQLHPMDVGCDPRVTIGSPLHSGAASPSQRSFAHTDTESGVFSLSSGSVSGSPPMRMEAHIGGRRKRRRPSFTSSEEEYRPGDSGESEKEDADESSLLGEPEADVEDDDDDDDYVLSSRVSYRARALRSRRAQSSCSPVPSISSAGARAARLHAPVPINGLTKKSRGRRVPTISPGAHSGGIVKGTRQYTCEVSGCGKCFARGEHLKRHIRSIHTNEKPHKCPFPGCGKDFSRHDNLGQHMRVHKSFSAPKEVA